MRSYSLFFYYIIFLMLPYFCGAEELAKPTRKPDEKRIAFLYSAHGSGGWNQELEANLRKDFAAFPEFQMKSFKIDIEQYFPSEKFKNSIPSLEAEINAFSPNLIIVFHDNIIQEYFKTFLTDTKTPVVICMDHTNEDDQLYWGLNFTGVLVMDMMPRLYGNLKHYTGGSRVTVISCKHVPVKTESLKKAYKDISVRNLSFSTYPEFTETYLKAQNESDVIILSFAALPKGWKQETSADFIMKNTRVPTGATSRYLAPYVMIAMAPATSEISSIIADSAMKILNGIAPSMISPKKSSELVFTVNVSVAEKLGITIPVPVLKTAKVVH